MTKKKETLLAFCFKVLFFGFCFCNEYLCSGEGMGKSVKEKQIKQCNISLFFLK